MRLVPAVFQWCLVLASTLPFVLVTWFAFAAERQASFSGLELAIGVIAFLNQVHVPATLYLYTDHMVRQHALAAPFRCIVMPALIMVTFCGAYLTAAIAGGATGDYSLLLILTAYLSWQMWHFGMQSYGVVAFLSMSSGRPPRSGQRSKLERCLITGGAVSGMMSFYHTLHPRDRLRTLPSVDYSSVDQIGTIIYGCGMVLCFGCTLAAVVYLLRHRREFTVPAATVFLVSVCFFLPDYLTAILPNVTPPNAMVSYLNFSLVHGIQYLVFIAFHAIGASRGAVVDCAREGEPWLAVAVAALLPLLLCLFFVFAVGEVITTGAVTSAFVTSIVALATTTTSGQVAASAAVGFAIGLAAAHFWIDQSLWKLSRPVQRQWVTSRYEIVLAG